jgi:topoisomerase-4 subunit A
MAKAKAPPQTIVHDVPLVDALGERYLAYALSTIMSRSLPDVRDGLKPVHRRLLYAMRQLRLDPASGFKKCARVVGDVIGKYHPHGDVAVYDTLVRLAQTFAVRYPLVDGQGNFGNIDGDNAAAMRYTEARLTTVAEALLEGIEEDSVDFRDTYDGEESEPVVLPARFPNLLANGSSGIAVGMSTNIPPHNAGELCEALLHLIKHPNVTFEKLVDLIPGPDFPTGGILVEPRESVTEAYRTGRGGFRLRARWMVEPLARGVWQIVVTEIPYLVPKARLIERIAELLQLRKVQALEDVRDESTDDVRLVLVPRSRTIPAEALMEQLFKLTDLEVRVPLNMNVLDATRTPRVMSLRDVLQAFLDHRHVVLMRRTRFRVEKIERRLEILAGFLIAYLNLDKVIRVIRTEDEPKPVLMKAFKLNDVQAEAILNMRLRQLRKLEEFEIKGEHDSLTKERTDLRRLLGNATLQWGAIADEIADIRKAFGAKTVLGRRRTEIGTAPDELDIQIEALVEKEPVTIVCSDKGWIRALKGHVEPETVRYKEGDRERFLLHAQSTDKVVLFATNGRFYALACDRLPGGRGQGEPVRLMIDLGNDHDVVTLLVHDPDRRLLIASDSGRGFIVAERDVIAQTRNGKQVLNVDAGEEAAVCAVVPANADCVAVIGDNRKLLIFPLKELPDMGRGRGVRLQRYKDGGLSDVTAFRKRDGLSWDQTGGERKRVEMDLAPWVGQRGQAGRLPPKGFPRSNSFTQRGRRG